MAYYDIGVSTKGDYKKFVRGTGVKSTTDTTKITLGFRPSFVMMYDKNTTSGGILYVAIWDSARANNQIFSYQNQVDFAMPASNPNVLASIDDDGFTVNRASAATVVNFEYIAMG